MAFPPTISPSLQCPVQPTTPTPVLPTCITNTAHHPPTSTDLSANASTPSPTQPPVPIFSLGGRVFSVKIIVHCIKNQRLETKISCIMSGLTCQVLLVLSCWLEGPLTRRHDIIKIFFQEVFRSWILPPLLAAALSQRASVFDVKIFLITILSHFDV